MIGTFSRYCFCVLAICGTVAAPATPAAAATVMPSDVLVVGSASNNIAVFTWSGSLRSLVPLPASASSPYDITRAPNGEIFVSRSDGTVHRFDADLNLLGSWNWGGGSTMYGVTAGPDGLIYCAGSGSSTVRVFTASGTLVRHLTSSASTNNRDIEFVGNETWVTNFSGSRIDVFDSTNSDIADLPAPAAPFGIRRAPNGDMWVADQNTHMIRRIDNAANTLLSFDADLGPFGALTGQLRFFGVDPSDGRLFVSDFFGTRVDIYDGGGVYQGTLSNPSLSGPGGIVVIPLGSEIFSDGFEAGNTTAW